MVFYYVRNGYITTSSSVITCLAAPSNAPTPFPSTPTLLPTPQPTSFSGRNYYIELVFILIRSLNLALLCFVILVTFSTLPSSLFAYSTVTITWTSLGGKSISGDWIGLFAQNVYWATWSSSIVAGSSTGTYSLTVPNSPGTQYLFYYVRNGYMNSASSLFMILAAPSNAPTPFPTAPTLFPTPQPSSFAG